MRSELLCLSRGGTYCSPDRTELLTPLGLRDSDRILVTGATGWLGRELIKALADRAPEVPLLAIASHPRECNLSTGYGFFAHEFNASVVAKWRPTIALHFAFVTKEFERIMPLGEYVHLNSAISEQAAQVFRQESVRAMVIASSGAAVSASPGLYGALKSKDESTFTSLARALGKNLVIARAWSLTGSECTKPERFLFFSILQQLLGPTQEIVISSQAPVFRRYMNAGEYLALCLHEAAIGSSCIINSSGELLEAEALAKRLQGAFGIFKPIAERVIDPDIPPDLYFCQGQEAVQRCRELGIGPSSIEEQALASVAAVRGFTP